MFLCQIENLFILKNKTVCVHGFLEGGVSWENLKGGSNQNIREGSRQMLTVLQFWEGGGVKPNNYSWLHRGEGGPEKLKKWLRNTWTALIIIIILGGQG